VAAGIAGSRDADPLRINLRARLEIGSTSNSQAKAKLSSAAGCSCRKALGPTRPSPWPMATPARESTELSALRADNGNTLAIVG
jgi:hypothetical protein